MTPERQERLRKVASQRQLDVTVLLENVHDPHNISAILRSCDAIGIPKIYLLNTDPRLQDDGVHQLSHRSSAGTTKWIEVVIFESISEAVSVLKSTYQRLLCAALVAESDDLYALDLTQSAAFVFGNEHEGVSSELQSHCTGSFIIPQVGMVQSLNVSVACAVSLYECYRQRADQGKYGTDLTTRQHQLYEMYKAIHRGEIKLHDEDESA
ncbi:MAG: RNA methyltransferase [Saprospiraceae bacterium]|nr:RNA methyltransferase [Saprospiraceae bacterium]